MLGTAFAAAAGSVFLVMLVWLVPVMGYNSQERYIPPQPVPFSHKHHVSGLGLDCRYCHTTVEVSQSAGMLATAGLDVQLHDTYFVIAHFRYIMVGGTVSAFFGGLHYWWPKITGRLYREMWARVAAILAFVGFNLTFFPQFILGYLGMPRRYYAYPPQWQSWNVFSSAGASILAIAYIMPLGYLIWSLFYGERAGAYPWRATGLEWLTSPPPPTYNLALTPVVTVEPYAYNPETGGFVAQDGSAHA